MFVYETNIWISTLLLLFAVLIAMFHIDYTPKNQLKKNSVNINKYKKSKYRKISLGMPLVGNITSPMIFPCAFLEAFSFYLFD